MSSCRLVARLAMAMVLCTLTFTVSAAVTSNRTRAECSGSANRWPAFSRMAPSARRIFVGTVIEGLNAGPRWFGRYRVRVDEVLRGPRREFMVIDFMTSGTPPSGSGACRRDRYLQAKVGDVIAFALGGRTAGVRGPVRTAAWLEGRPSGWNPGIERLSLAKVRRIARELPDTATEPSSTPATTPDGADTPVRPNRLGWTIIAALACVLTQSLHVAAQDGGLVDDAIRFRRSVGLRADRDFVASTFGSDQYAADEFGVPLSEQEVAEIQERQSRTASAAPGHDWARTQPGFAGAWTDQSQDGLIVYLFSTGVSAARAELDRLLPPEVRYEVRGVERSLADLRGLERRIAADIPSLEADGIEVLSIGLAISDNTLRVGVVDGVARARDAIQSAYGDFIEVAWEDPGQADACTGTGG